MLPPTNEAPLCERLEPLSEDNCSVASLIDRYVAFDATTNNMRKWFTDFGVENEGRLLLQTIDCHQVQEHISGQIRAVFEEILSQKERASNEQIDIYAEKYRIHKAKLAQEEAERLEREAAEAAAALEAEQERSGSATQEIPSSSMSKSKAATEAPTQNQTKSSVAADVSKEESAPPDMQSPRSDKPSLPGRDNLDGDFRPIIMGHWKDLSVTYKKQMRSIFRNIRLHREHILERQADVQQNFLKFLHRLDGK